ncbi:SDR family oxidoreductase [Sphingomicrobium sp. XHP0235]|uniref:SDR family oxidoreductase n=1 Tax=Sphingomicrobium aquimarinum TaxID=3133971 RepID=UPI0031FE69AE
MSNRFEGKRILITGGTNGIGLATAKRIVEEGGEVAVTGHSQDHLDQAGRELPSGSLVLRNDASDPEAAKELASKVKDQMGQVDGLYLNAGYGGRTPAGETEQETFDRMMNTNVRGPVLQMAQLAEHVKDGGAVLLTGSVATHSGMPGGGVYGATKASVSALARSWAKELGERKIRVNSVAPGPIDTGFMAKFAEESGGMDEEDKKEMAKRIKQQVALGRFGNPEEVAAVTTFLLSDDASYVNGSEYVVDGGMILR